MKTFKINVAHYVYDNVVVTNIWNNVTDVVRDIVYDNVGDIVHVNVANVCDNITNNIRVDLWR